MDEPAEALCFNFMLVGLGRTMNTGSEACVAAVVTVIDVGVVVPLACGTRAGVFTMIGSFLGIIIDAALNISGGVVIFAGVAVNL